MKGMVTLGKEQIFTSHDNPKGNTRTERMIGAINERVSCWLNELSRLQEAKEKIGKWIEFGYNKLYVHFGLEYLSCEEYEELYYQRLMEKEA